MPNLPLTSPEDVINDALVRIGWKFRIGSIYDGSLAAKLSLQIYSQTRDALLRSATWGFAQRIAPGVAAGFTPPLPWTNAYDFPDDCLRVRDVYSGTYRRNNPSPNLWTLYNRGNLLIPGEWILSYLSDAQIVYTGTVHDPSEWETLFTETLCAMLGRRLASGLSSIDQSKLGTEDEKVGEEAAAGVIVG